MENLNISNIVGLNRLPVDKITDFNCNFLVGKDILIRSNELLEDPNPISGKLTARYDTEIGVIFVVDDKDYHLMEKSEVAILFEEGRPRFVFFC
jgi:hypothetical protein